MNPELAINLDPFVDVPKEAEDTRVQILDYINYFSGHLPNIGSAIKTPSPEGDVYVGHGSIDDNGRDIPLRVDIIYVKSRMGVDCDRTETETHEIYCYESGVAIRKIVYASMGKGFDDIRFSQPEFITEKNIHLLKYAKQIFSRAGN